MIISQQQARLAKTALKRVLTGSGAAISISKIGDDYAISVSVPFSHNLPNDLPAEIDGVKIAYKVVGPARPLI